jgi:phosphatidate cytidylyltransferase
MLVQRIITALLLAVVVIGTILFLDHRAVALLFAVALFFATNELVALTLTRKLPVRGLIAAACTALFLFSLPQIGIRPIAYHAYTGLLAWMLVLLMLRGYRHNGRLPLAPRLALFLFAAALLWIAVQGLAFIPRHFPQGNGLLLYLMTLVWVADIGAYFSGRAFGRRKLAPAISPGKTLEGVLGGLLLNLLWISGVWFYSGGWGIAYPPFLLVSLVTVGFSVVGDLFESILKREAGVKDSSQLLPGHGGVLDRIDSLIAATPVFLAGLFLLGGV